MIKMTLKPLAVRIPEDLEKQIREIIVIAKADKTAVVRNLLELGVSEWRKNSAIELLETKK